jgi:hypothetical protein
MALSEVRELEKKLAKLELGTSEYKKTLALLNAERKKEQDKISALQIKSKAADLKKETEKKAKEKSADLAEIKRIKDYNQRDADLGNTFLEPTFQKRLKELLAKYPSESAPLKTQGSKTVIKPVVNKPTVDGKGTGSTGKGTGSTGKGTGSTGKGTGSTGKGTGSGSGTGGEVKLTDAQRREQALETAANADFTLPETLFNNVPSLKLLLKRYVDEDWTPEKLRKAIRDDVWYRKNSEAIRNRYVQLYNFRDLVKTGQAQGTTQYEQDIVSLERKIADKARKIGSGIASDPDALRKAAENMYITNVGIDDAMTTDFIAAAIRPITSTIGGVKTEGYSGEALTDYQAIQKIARSNGFTVKDIVPGGKTELQILQGLATGSIDANRLAQDARKLAAQGQPQYVRDLLGQGYDLDQIFAPYRQVMANLLEINQDQIDLNDPMLRNGITEKGDMNIFDFKKTLKKDSRWQYTENAKTEVSDITLRVLRDFGFQG